MAWAAGTRRTARGTRGITPLRRRTAARTLLALAALAFASAHTPYRQWKVYRQRRLLILTSRSDPESFPLGKRVAQLLAEALPSSQAQVSRAPHSERIASQLTTGQMDVAILRRGEAAALARREPPFEDFQPVALRALVGLGPFLLVARDDLPEHHAYLLAQALDAHRGELPVPLSPASGGAGEADGLVSMHRGARAFFAGQPLPVP